MRENSESAALLTSVEAVMEHSPSGWAGKFVVVAVALPQHQEGLLRIFAKRFDDIIMSNPSSGRARTFAEVAAALPQHQEGLLRIFAERFDDIIMSNPPTSRAPRLAKVVAALPEYSGLITSSNEDMTACTLNNYFKNKNELEIRKNSRLLAQGFRDVRVETFSLFKKLPEENCVKIVGLSGNRLDHNEEESEQIASNHFGRPKL